MDNEKNIILIVITGTLILVLLILAIVIFVVTYNKKLQQRLNEHSLELKNKELELLRTVIETQEIERDKIAANLHDEVGPLIARLKLDISGMKRAFKKETLTVEKFEKENEFIDTIIENVRSVSHDLSPSFLIKFGLTKAIYNYVSEFNDIDVQIINVPDIERVYTRHITTNIYRILLELINNTIKYESCSKLQINFTHQENIFEIVINHDGNGISNQDFESFARSSNGLGLTSIQSRILILNANLEFQKMAGKPKVRISIPLSKHE